MYLARNRSALMCEKFIFIANREGKQTTVLKLEERIKQRRSTLTAMAQSFYFKCYLSTFRHISPELWACSFPFQSRAVQLERNESSSVRGRHREGLNVWMSGRWSERAGLLSGGNKYCRGQWETIHLFNVPSPKWNPCNPTDMATSPCISPRWNLIRAKTVYQCLQPDIYWKWPLVKVIAKAWRGFLMRRWSFSIFRASKAETGVLIEQYISHISWDADVLRGLNAQTITSAFTQKCENL